MVTKPISNEQYRNKNGDISRKYGNTLILALRQTFGSNFALGFLGQTKLSEVLDKIDDASLSKLTADVGE
jgi:hypothetical protein